MRSPVIKVTTMTAMIRNNTITYTIMATLEDASSKKDFDRSIHTPRSANLFINH